MDPDKAANKDTVAELEGDESGEEGAGRLKTDERFKEEKK